MRSRAVLALLFLLLAALPAAAKEAVPAAEDPVLEARTLELASKLRCLVCQNQTLADSNAELALDLRRQVREQIKAGKTDQQITDYMVQRYGDFVLYQPPFKGTTFLLWVGPFVLLVVGVWLLLRQLARRRRIADEPALGGDERRIVDEMLKAGRGEERK